MTDLLMCYCWFGQVQAQLEQTLEKLQGEQALNQQLSAEVEQVHWCRRPFVLISKNMLFFKLSICSFIGSKTASEPSRTVEVS